jgi:response regulator of citrate/malate metabolism
MVSPGDPEDRYNDNGCERMHTPVCVGYLCGVVDEPMLEERMLAALTAIRDSQTDFEKAQSLECDAIDETRFNDLLLDDLNTALPGVRAAATATAGV